MPEDVDDHLFLRELTRLVKKDLPDSLAAFDESNGGGHKIPVVYEVTVTARRKG